MTPTGLPEDDRRRLDQFLEGSGLAARGARVEPLAGDASDRRYFRLTVSGLSSRVVTLYPDPAGDGVRTFTRVAELFGAMGVPVPRVIARADELGILVLEDLGDVSLQAHLAGAPAAERTARYRAAIGIIQTLQRRGRELASLELPPYGLAFDEETLTRELEFFTTHFLEGHVGASLSPASYRAIRVEYGALARALAAEPRVLCHRDFHSRNLMVQGDRLRVIDFQDARMGPNTYDLVSLLRDAYVDVSADEVESLTTWFLDTRADTERLEIDAVARRKFRRRFERMAVQRTLKALGTFGYQASARHNPAYLQYVPRTLAHARASLTASDESARLQALLADLIPELG